MNHSILRHHLQTKKNIECKIIYKTIKKFADYIIFSICEQFLIPLKEAGMKLSIPNFLRQWYKLVEYKKILFLSRVSYLVTWRNKM